MKKVLLPAALLALFTLCAHAQQSAPAPQASSKAQAPASAQAAGSASASGQGTAPAPTSEKATSATPAKVPAKTLVFSTVDLDKDGRVSFVEAKKAGMATEDFRRAETDHDGYISEKEWKAAFGN